MKWRVPFFDLQLGDEEKQSVRDVLDSNWITAGPRIADFEARFSMALGGEVASVAVSSATAALHLSLLALGVGPGDEVLVPSLTFVACANAIRYTGAIPVFVDIVSDDDWNICPIDSARKISPKTKAIMVVHYAGYPCAMDSFLTLAGKYGLNIIEDCSHAPLASIGGRMVGTIGKVGCFSFFSNKNLTTGEGGMVTTHSSEIAERLRVLRSHGITASTYQRFKGHAYGYDVAELGFNYRLDEIRAALGIEQLKKLSNFTSQRRERVQHYRELLKTHLPEVKAPFENYQEESSFHIFPVLLPCGIDRRNGILKMMGEQGIQCSMHYRPIHTFSAYEGHPADVPVTDRVADSILTLPLFPTISDEQMLDVIETLKKCLMSI